MERCIYWRRCVFEPGSMYLAASSRGLVYAGPFHAAFSEMKQWLAARYPGYELVESEAWLQPYAASLAAYFEGRRTGEWPPLDLSGTPFQRSVWQALLEIPYGETRTYAEIASRIGKPSAVRAVASAIGANPALVFVPCHRVIGKNGELRGFRGGLDMKRALLDLESR